MVGVCSPFLDIYECRSTGGVRRNIERFEGADFMVQLSWDEVAELSRTQIATLNKGRGFNIKSLHVEQVFAAMHLYEVRME